MAGIVIFSLPKNCKAPASSGTSEKVLYMRLDFPSLEDAVRRAKGRVPSCFFFPGPGKGGPRSANSLSVLHLDQCG